LGVFQPGQGTIIPVGPAITAFNNELVLVYVANNGTNDLLFATSSNGTGWNNSKPVTGQQSPYTPAVTVLGGELYIAYVANNGSNDLIVMKTKDLGHWTTTTVAGQTSPMGPALAAIQRQPRERDEAGLNRSGIPESPGF
jgi:DNA-binding beta-propeller fold protein YncE